MSQELKDFNPNAFKRPNDLIWEDLGIIAGKLHEELGCKDPLTKVFIQMALLGIKIFDRKQRSYGPGNIAKFSDYGVLVRSHDKQERLVNLYTGGLDPAEEGRDDTWGDKGVYSYIALMCRWNLWPGAKPHPVALVEPQVRKG